MHPIKTPFAVLFSLLPCLVLMTSAANAQQISGDTHSQAQPPFNANINANDVSLVLPNSAVVPNDQTYYTQSLGDTQLIFTQQNKRFAEHTARVEKILQPLYQASFGYKMDSPLWVGLMSSNNQIANGFSTQYPLNRQINYLGGAQIPDYFASSSWLDTLLLHETAHNYQTNAKDNFVSQSMFSVFRNGGFALPFFPATTPNIFESSFILEGNAVLNESWHGLGGRLYSGRYRAMAALHANAGYLTPARLYNSTLNFPYGEGHYIFGASYQYYLAKQYGLNTSNLYFKNRSKNWYLPFTVDAPTKQTFGIGFEHNISNWAQDLRLQHKDFEMVGGKVLARSQYFADLNTQQDQVLFATSPQGVHQPRLQRLNIHTLALTSVASNLGFGRIFNIPTAALTNNDAQKDSPAGKLYSIASRATSVTQISQGLFDNDGFALAGSEGKIIQGYLNDGRAVYFDVVSSFIKPQLYVGDEFYSAVNSSVLVKNNQLYYFVQQGKQRVLYKNKQAIYAFNGYYGTVADVDENGNIYFIANTQHGSGLFKVATQNSQGVAVQAQQVIAGDNILAAKLLAHDKVLIEALSADEYYYVVQALNTELVVNNTAPYEVTLFWDEPSHPLYSSQSAFSSLSSSASLPSDSSSSAIADSQLQDSQEYSALSNMRYVSGSYASVNDSNGEKIINMAVSFADPLTYNQFTVWAQKDANQSNFLGLAYQNNQHRLLYGANVYYVAKNGLEEFAPTIKTRDHGVALDVKYPLLRAGHWQANIETGYAQDYKNIERQPISLNAQAQYALQYGNSYFVNKLLAGGVFASQDRGDTMGGLQINAATDFSGQLYANGFAKHTQTNGQVSNFENRGIELSSAGLYVGNDQTGLQVNGIRDDVYAKQASAVGFGFAKVFDWAKYYLKFPVSIRREALSLDVKHYQLNEVAGFGDVSINQISLTLGLELLMVNKFPIRLNFESIQNDDETLTDKALTQISLQIAL